MPVGRPRKVETAEAIAGAMEAFLCSGYQATSLPDLEAATGLTKGSLYKAFRDKHDLFLQALDLYLERALALQEEILGATGSGNERLSRWTQFVGRNCSRSGCLAAKAAEELGENDPDVRERLVAYWSKTQARLAEVIALGLEDGSLRTTATPESVAALFCRTAIGLSVTVPIGLVEDDGNPLDSLLKLLES